MTLFLGMRPTVNRVDLASCQSELFAYKSLILQAGSSFRPFAQNPLQQEGRTRRYALVK